MPRQFGVPEEVIDRVASGATQVSEYSSYLSPIHDKHVIGINNAYMIGNWLDVCFFGDCGWYLVHREGLAKWRNLKVTCCNRFAKRRLDQHEGIKYLEKDSSHRHGITKNPRRVSWNGNSGAAAISLAYHFGVKRITLLGFDMCLNSGKSHWHKGHGNKKPPPFARHLKGFPTIAEDAKALGIEILNASQISVIEDFTKVELKEVLNGPGIF